MLKTKKAKILDPVKDPQYKPTTTKSFVLTYDGDQFVVSYEVEVNDPSDETVKQLYPAE